MCEASMRETHPWIYCVNVISERTMSLIRPLYSERPVSIFIRCLVLNYIIYSRVNFGFLNRRSLDCCINIIFRMQTLCTQVEKCFEFILFYFIVLCFMWFDCISNYNNIELKKKTSKDLTI